MQFLLYSEVLFPNIQHRIFLRSFSNRHNSYINNVYLIMGNLQVTVCSSHYKTIFVTELEIFLDS